MRREPFAVGSYVHAVKRGARGLVIFQDGMDWWRCMLMLRHFNDEFHSVAWFRDLLDEGSSHNFNRASIWPEQRPIVSILAFTLMPNHLHLLLREVREGGIATFMGKLGKGIVLHANEKYDEHGSLFQGPYRSRTVATDEYFKCVCAYIMIKNVFELYPGGYKQAAKNFDKAYEWSTLFPYSSLMDYSNKRDSGILDMSFVKELFPTPNSFRQFALDYILERSGDLPHDCKKLE